MKILYIFLATLTFSLTSINAAETPTGKGRIYDHYDHGEWIDIEIDGPFLKGTIRGGTSREKKIFASYDPATANAVMQVEHIDGRKYTVYYKWEACVVEDCRVSRRLNRFTFRPDGWRDYLAYSLTELPEVGPQGPKDFSIYGLGIVILDSSFGKYENGYFKNNPAFSLKLGQILDLFFIKEAIDYEFATQAMFMIMATYFDP